MFFDDLLVALYVGLPGENIGSTLTSVCHGVLTYFLFPALGSVVSVGALVTALVKVEEGSTLLEAWVANRPGFAPSVMRHLAQLAGRDPSAWVSQQAATYTLRLCRLFPHQAYHIR